MSQSKDCFILYRKTEYEQIEKDLDSYGIAFMIE